MKKNMNNIEDFELTLFDRIEIIRELNEIYDLENKSYISFSGGKDSTILHYLIDLALPNNNIPRVYVDTGIEYLMIKEFVFSIKDNDSRVFILKPSNNINYILNTYGYPFKSKEHSKKLFLYKSGSRCNSVLKYKNGNDSFSCPNILKYQFEDSFNILVSDKCCMKLKKEPFKLFSKEFKKPIAITGLRRSEGGQRKNIKNCIITDSNGKISHFHPLLPLSDDFITWFIEKYNIKLCELYYPPYNFKRTGCKGCPFSTDLDNQLSIMRKYLPIEFKQCMFIWNPIYKEYLRLQYRIHNNFQYSLFENIDK